ncbi:MAG: hypothetical protein JST16_06620 [Bdellovibrionales bacterium]|nr:hypothetical protein [Bdellovibrionales bacterium]
MANKLASPLFLILCLVCRESLASCVQYDKYASIKLNLKSYCDLPDGVQPSDSGVPTPDGSSVFTGTDGSVSLLPEISSSATGPVSVKDSFSLEGAVSSRALVVGRGGAKYTIAVGSNAGEMLMVEMPERRIHSYRAKGEVFEMSPALVGGKITFVARSGFVRVFSDSGQPSMAQGSPLTLKLSNAGSVAEFTGDTGIFSVGPDSFATIASKTSYDSEEDVISSGTFYSVDLGTRKKSDISLGEFIPQSLTSDSEGNFFFGTKSHLKNNSSRDFVSLNSTGRARFRTSLPCAVTRKSIRTGSSLMVPCSDKSVYKIDANSGAILGKYTFPENLGSDIEYIGKDKVTGDDLFAAGVGGESLCVLDSSLRLRSCAKVDETVQKVAYLGNGTLGVSGLTKRLQFYSVGRPSGEIVSAVDTSSCTPFNLNQPTFGH